MPYQIIEIGIRIKICHIEEDAGGPSRPGVCALGEIPVASLVSRGG